MFFFIAIHLAAGGVNMQERDLNIENEDLFISITPEAQFLIIS